MSSRNFLLVYNDKAGKGLNYNLTAPSYRRRFEFSFPFHRGSFNKKLQYIEKLFRERGICFKSINIMDLNNTVRMENFDTVVAIGGDGTILSVLPYIVNKNIKLGIIPCGTANLLAQKLNIPKNIPQAVDVLINGTKKLIDVGKADDLYFVLRVGYGIDADIVNGASSFLKNKFGYLAYLIQGLKCVFNLAPKSFEICTDNKCFKVKASAVIVSNSGNMFRDKCSIAPHSDVSDGKLDVFVLYARNIKEFLTVFFQILFNKHEIGPNVLYAKTHNISIKSANTGFHIDGEACSSRKVDISLIHNGLAVMTP